MIQYKFVPASDYGKLFLETLLPQKAIAIDVETSGLLWYKDYIKTIAFCVGVGETYVVNPFGTADIERLRWALREFYGRYEGVQIYHNAKFDIHMIREFIKMDTDFFWNAKISDTMIMACLVDENRYVGLKALAEDLLNVKRVSMEEDLMYYNAQDAENTYRLWELFKPTVREKFNDLYLQELDLIKVLIDIERSGMCIDVPYFRQLKVTIEKQLLAYQQQFLSVFNRKINPNSAEQMAFALRALGHDSSIEYTDLDNVSIPNKVLQRLSETDEVVGALFEYRKLGRLLTTYVDNYIEMNVDGMLYPNFNQSSSEKKKGNGNIREDGLPISTGRLSSSNPNLQNVPVKQSDIIRKGFIIKDNPFYYLDYSNIEYRIVAHYSQEPALIKAYNEGGDMHQVTADALKVDRSTGKTMNFAIVYGAGSKKIARSLGIEEEEAKEILLLHHTKFPKLYQTQQNVMTKLRRQGYVTNMYGRYRRLRGDEVYKGFNSLIQGSAADMFKSVMVKVWKKYRGTDSVMKIPIHDELVFESPDIEVMRNIKKIMEDEPIYKKMTVNIPVTATISTTNWAEEVEVVL